MTTELADSRDFQELANALTLASDVITKDYLCQLKSCELCPLPDELEDVDIAEYTRLYHFRRFVLDKDEPTLDKLVTVLNAAYTSHSTVLTIINGHASYTDYYVGVVSKDVDQGYSDISTQGNIFQSVFTGNFPGLTLSPLYDEEIHALTEDIFSYDYITSISGIASLRKEKQNGTEKYVQGIEHLVDALQGKEYTVLLIADPVGMEELETTRRGYEQLYSQLSSFLKTSLTFNESDAISWTQTDTEGTADSITESTSLTQGYSNTNGWNSSRSHSDSVNQGHGTAIGAVLGAGVGIAATVLTGGIAAPVVAAAATAATAAGGTLGNGIIGSKGRSDSDTYGSNGSTTNSSNKTTGKSEGHTKQSSQSIAQGESSTHGRSMQFTSENRTVKDLLEKINKHIERLDQCKAFGAFNCAAYVISSDPETNAMAASGYNALMRGDNSSLQASYINNWTPDDNIAGLKGYLRRYSHPLFENRVNPDIVVSPASLANSYEVAVNIGLPKKSINGLPVHEMARFGRNVYRACEENSSHPIPIGRIHHMGMTETTPVSLDMESLSMHTFITGSTGSGKSNTVYQMLEQLKRQGVSFLVIEPAKGEYKHVFGNRKDVQVYGTNPKLTPLLKLNPFSFPHQIHVLEHIDRLVEIFNACWPMYAAMPAIMKDAIERCYVNAGWDLERSTCRDNQFPTFYDLLTILPTVVQESAYSADTQSDYSGALVTRVKSLTNGINGRIFCAAEEISNRKLFDQNVIVDLSRVGASESKALLMGILVLKLQEYRMCSQGMNAPLKHITVLEEAHNLLRRTSVEQQQESSNLQGKSIEMLTNAIAEMRTYGEGFMIADQSPNLLDASAIRNTNTKIVLRLPDMNDREVVGKAAGLSEQQINELARLPMGVAAIYQNDWLEPVLCHINKFDAPEGNYKFEPKQQEELDCKEIFAAMLNYAPVKDLNAKKLKQIKFWLKAHAFPDEDMKDIVAVISGKSVDHDVCSRSVYNFFDGKKYISDVERANANAQAIERIVENINARYSLHDSTFAHRILDEIVKAALPCFRQQSTADELSRNYIKGGGHLL